MRRAHLSAWVTHLREYRTTRGLPLKPKSVNKKIENVRGFLNYLADDGLIHPALPASMEYVKEPKLLPASVLTHDQVRRILRSVRTDSTTGYRDRAMLELLYSTGVRASELLSLDMNHIDYRNRTVLFRGKGEKDRVVPIGRTALHHLETYVKAVRPYLATDDSGSAVFLSKKGHRLPYYMLRRMIGVYAKKARVDINVTAHSFRRSCATEMLRAGAGMYHVKELPGHESLDTIKHYAKLTITDLKETHRKCHPRERDPGDDAANAG